MRVEIRLDPNCGEAYAIIVTDKVTDEINDTINVISNADQSYIVGFSNGTAQIIEPNEIIRIYTENGKLYLQTDKNIYTLKQRLYEMEARLQGKKFVRISNSEIVNLRKVKNFDLSPNGTVKVELKNGVTTYVSRRNIPKIKKILGI